MRASRSRGVLEGAVCAGFCRGNDYHKFVAVDEHWEARMAKPELAALPETTFAALLRLCPRVGMAKGDAWFEADKAVAYLKEHPTKYDLDALLR